MNRPPQFPLARQSDGLSVKRRPGSIRRTTTIDSQWPLGVGAPFNMVGKGRDMLTHPDGTSQVVASQAFDLQCSVSRQIMAIETMPLDQRAQNLVGVRAGRSSRQQLNETLGDLRGSVLFQLLDDFAGASLVAPWAWSNWIPDWPPQQADGSAGPKSGAMVNICTGFASGSSALRPDLGVNTGIQSSAPVADLGDPDDPLAWHDLPDFEGPQMRRARRLDLWRDGAVLKADVGFQDSGSLPAGGRRGVHEYRLFAEIDATSGTLAAIRAEALVLPYAECPGAVLNLNRLIGKPVNELRTSVTDELAGTLGCTHLNDVARSLADALVLADALP